MQKIGNCPKTLLYYYSVAIFSLASSNNHSKQLQPWPGRLFWRKHLLLIENMYLEHKNSWKNIYFSWIFCINLAFKIDKFWVAFYLSVFAAFFFIKIAPPGCGSLLVSIINHLCQREKCGERKGAAHLLSVKVL